MARAISFNNVVTNLSFQLINGFDVCVARSTILLKSWNVDVWLLHFWKQKCIDHVSISHTIHRDGSSFLIWNEIWTDDAVGVYSTPNIQL